MVNVKNKSNGKKSSFTDAQWDNVKKDPKWSGVFEVINIEKPEVINEIPEIPKKDKPESDEKKTEKPEPKTTEPKPKTPKTQTTGESKK